MPSYMQSATSPIIIDYIVLPLLQPIYLSCVLVNVGRQTESCLIKKKTLLNMLFFFLLDYCLLCTSLYFKLIIVNAFLCRHSFYIPRSRSRVSHGSKKILMCVTV